MGVGKTIAKFRQKKGMTQKELSECATISKKYLADIEEGFKTPHLKTIARIADALGVSIEELLKKK